MELQNFPLKFSIFLQIILRCNFIGAIPVEDTTTEISKTHSQDNQPDRNREINDELFHKARSYILYSPGFRNYSAQDFRDFLNDLEMWEEPNNLKKGFPYYFSGHDLEDRPVWLAEIGKFKIRQEVEKGPKNVEIILKYTFKAILRIIKTIQEKDTLEKEVRHGSFLLDFNGYDMYQIAHMDSKDTRALAFMLQVVRDYKEVIDEFMGYCIIVNVNPLAQQLLNLMRPMLGRVFERIETYGMNKAKWLPIVRRQFPDYLIPSWYGGSPTFKPIQTYG